MKKVKKRERSSELTGLQDDCLIAIDRLTRFMGFPPTYAEISEAMGIPGIGAITHVSSLIGKGFVDRQPRSARTIRLTPKGKKAL